MRGVWRPKSAPGQSWNTDRGFRANACVQNSWKPQRPENRVLAAASSPTHPPTKAHEWRHAEGHQHTLLFLLISVSPFKHPPFPPCSPPPTTHTACSVVPGSAGSAELPSKTTSWLLTWKVCLPFWQPCVHLPCVLRQEEPPETQRG